VTPQLTHPFEKMKKKTVNNQIIMALLDSSGIDLIFCQNLRKKQVEKQARPLELKTRQRT